MKHQAQTGPDVRAGVRTGPAYASTRLPLGLPGGGLYALTADRRRRIEATIEQLIAMLDAADGDPDLESNGDAEPDNEGEADHEGEASLYQPMPLAPFGTPISTTFTNPHGQSGCFVGVGRPVFDITPLGRRSLAEGFGR